MTGCSRQINCSGGARAGFGQAVSRLGFILAGILIIILLASGCTLAPKYTRPVVETPTGFLGQADTNQAASLADLPWWKVFDDETLQDLIQTALTNNYDLRIAITKVEQYWQLAAQSRAAFFPQAQIQGDLTRGENEFRGSPSPGTGLTGSPVMLAASAAWELDLWGRVRSLNAADRAAWLATEEARRGVTLSLVCGVAQAYIELLTLDAQLAITRAATNSFGESLQLFSRKLAGGAASKLETARAEAALAGSAAMQPDLERQIVLKENQINLLLGRNPGPIPRTTTLIEQTTWPEIPAGLPSDLLQRRPDIRQAEQVLRSANAQIGVANANFLPKIGLTAMFGRVSPELNDFNAGISKTWSAGGNLLGPLFQGGLLVAQRRQAIAYREQVRLQYEQTVRTGFQDVANALITRVKLEEVCVQQERQTKALTEAVAVAFERYMAGKADYYEVLEAQQQLFPALNDLATTRANRLLAVVQLYKALGGGWKLTDSAWSGQP